MKPIKVLHMYADILDLYGDSGNLEILSYRCRMRQIPFLCDHYRLNDPVPNFSDYDLIYLGGGADMEQRMLSSDLLRCKKRLATSLCRWCIFSHDLRRLSADGEILSGCRRQRTAGAGLI